MSGPWVRSSLFLIAAAIVVSSGFGLTRNGRPFPSRLLNVHKLVALAAVVSLVALVVQSHRAGGLSTSDVGILGSAAGLCASAFVSGGLISAVESSPRWVVLLHRVVVWPAAVSIALCLGVVV